MRARSLLTNAVLFAAPGVHVVTVTGFPDRSVTALAAVNHSGELEWDEPEVEHYLDQLLREGTAISLVLHVLSDEVAFTDAQGGEVLVKHVYGWFIEDGEIRPVTAAEAFDIGCVDPDTGEPVPPQPGVRYENAWPLVLEGEGSW
ncbi:hypothetical protein EIL87_19165 [Saccharopolyspora rhizosphaerae]|uniref:Uncharacterized protein n=1 Tax=Saccharopolyspora rhizosphaerae TaxID=2492662 RepID=A0A3R8Q7G2_9PSEU|nr:hypothetical protein [Saccharopolyspora rhizosphaerae]RRO14850.1 hypothetical protein EIL87_19165 [Saccharopolyspora rhizosphaerae]